MPGAGGRNEETVVEEIRAHCRCTWNWQRTDVFIKKKGDGGRKITFCHCLCGKQEIFMAFSMPGLIEKDNMCRPQLGHFLNWAVFQWQSHCLIITLIVWGIAPHDTNTFHWNILSPIEIFKNKKGYFIRFLKIFLIYVKMSLSHFLITVYLLTFMVCFAKILSVNIFSGQVFIFPGLMSCIALMEFTV